MKRWLWFLAGVLAVAGGLCAAPLTASAATGTLELKRLESPRGRAASPTDYLFQMTNPQHFFMQVRAEQKEENRNQYLEAFKRIVKKELEKYQSEQPFRGVAKLGSDEYAFVLDAKDDKSAGYGRLIFDRNRNGDLTDDEVVVAEQPTGVVFPPSYANYQFPRVDLTINAEGTKVDYAFFFSVYSQTSKDFSYVSASLSAAAYREGEIALDGQKRRVALLDFNSNGRFDDETKIPGDIRMADGQVYVMPGDILVVDPDKVQPVTRFSYDVTSGGNRHHVSKLVGIDGRFYDLKTTAAGDKLTLNPSTAAVGEVTNPNQGFRALVYGEKGFLNISGEKSKPVPLPEGEWKLASYTIDQTGFEPPKKPAAKDKPKERSLLQMLAGALTGSDVDEQIPAGMRYTIVSASATADYKPVVVRKGETAAFPFGPPYKAVVKVDYRPSPEEVALGMSLVGSAGEMCTDLMVDGKRPEAPEFTITNPKGEVVERGKFSYG